MLPMFCSVLPAADYTDHWLLQGISPNIVIIRIDIKYIEYPKVPFSPKKEGTPTYISGFSAAVSSHYP